MIHQALLRAPFAVIGILTCDDFITGIEFLPLATPTLAPRQNSLAYLACVQLNAYFDDAGWAFDLPLKFSGTAHQIKVWEALKAIPRGQAMTYGNLSTRLHSAPRAVGQACGRNPLPIVIPCHRVVGSHGLGGFMGGRLDDPLTIKRWLLRHEGYIA